MVTVPAELAIAELLPIEIRYVMAMRPSRFETFRMLLEQGYGIGVRTVEKTPERILEAVSRISHESQANTILPWLERLLREEELPIFSPDDLAHSRERGADLMEDAKMILAERFEFRKIVLVDLKNRSVGSDIQQLMDDVNRDLYPLSVDAIVHRVTFDSAHTRTKVAQSILKALVVIGPVAHLLEHALSGLGKLFAASADDVLSETAELFALRGSGFTWRQLIGRSRWLIVVFALATFGAFQVTPLIHAGRIGLAGLIFGLSAVALSLTTAIQSIFLYRASFRALVESGKLRLASGQTLFGLAMHQDFTNPARLGLFMGAIASPLLAAGVFTALPQWIENGWTLALLGSVESMVAGVTVIAAQSIERAVFRWRVRRALAKLVPGGI